MTSKHHDNPSPVHIIVNARKRDVTGKTITYEQVVALAFPDDPSASQFLYSVHYVGPHMPDGTLAAYSSEICHPFHGKAAT
jgi:hypothetical protein